jgi:hypothetical protein
MTGFRGGDPYFLWATAEGVLPARPQLQQVDMLFKEYSTVLYELREMASQRYNHFLQLTLTPEEQK